MSSRDQDACSVTRRRAARRLVWQGAALVGPGERTTEVTIVAYQCLVSVRVNKPGRAF